MKKIYNSPTIETAELHLHTAIMSGVGQQGGSEPPQSGGDQVPPPHTVRRKVF